MSVLLVDRIVNLVEEGVDLAVRIGPLPDSNLAAKRVGSVRRMLVASPAYLARRGTPQVPADLKLHSVIAFTGLMPNRELRFRDANGASSVSVDPIIEINDAQTAVDAAEMGHGITIALSYMVHDRILSGKLVAVLDTNTQLQPVNLVYPQSRLVAPKVRAFVDFAAPRLKHALFQLS